MPELPEVENVVRGLTGVIIGRTIVKAVSRSKRVMPPADARRLKGRTIRSIERRGKHIVVALDEGFLDVHLGMTGKLLVDGVETPYTRAVLSLDRGTLIYDDVRQFGHIRWSRRMPERVEHLGAEPLLITADEFRRLLAQRRGRIKPLLLNQRFLAGVGNIYADEALFRARLHPLTSSVRISAARARGLHAVLVDVLRQAIDEGGSSISDYVDAAGQPGSFQDRHQVYGREGEACTRCGTPIRRIVVAQRGTHYCPRCQR